MPGRRLELRFNSTLGHLLRVWQFEEVKNEEVIYFFTSYKVNVTSKYKKSKWKLTNC